MGYLNNSGSGFLSNAVTTVSNVKSYLVNKTGYLVDSIRVGIGDFGQRVLDDGGTIEASAEAAASYREITKDIYDQASLVLFPSGYKDNLLYSHKPVNGSGDFTYTRGTDTATRVGADGYIKKERANLLEQSNQFDTTWVINTSVSEGEEGYDGTTDAWSLTRAATGSLMGKQTVSLSGVSTYSIYAKINTNNGIGLALGGLSTAARFDLRDATKTQAVTETGIISSSQKYVGNGFYRLSITANVSGSTEARIYLTTADATTSDSNGGTHIIQDAQVEQGLVATSYIETTTAPVYEGLTDNLPRIDYTGGTPSILLEPSRTNLWKYTEYLDYPFSNIGDVTITQNTTETLSPEGLYNAVKLEGVGGWIFRDAIAGTDTGTWTISCYVKAVNPSSNNTFRLSIGGNNFSSNLTATSEWQRFEHTFTNGGATASGILRDSSTNDADLYIYGLQVEQGSYPTSYIPTYGSSVTRNGEQIVNTNISSIINTSNSYTIFFDFTRPNADYVSAWQLIGIDNGGYTSRLKIVQRPNFDQFRVNVYDGTTNATSSEIDNSAQNKIAVVYDGSTSYKIFTNGTLLQTLSCGAINGTRLTSGENGTQRTIDNYQQISLFPTALSDVDCIALTAL